MREQEREREQRERERRKLMKDRKGNLESASSKIRESSSTALG